MAIIRPFRGYRYNKEKVENRGAVLAPPYDSIDEDEQHKLYDMDKYNIVRVIRGMEYEDDTETDSCYTRAKKYLDDWISSGILVRDKKPAIYLYEQRLEYHHATYANRGFVVQMRLCDIEEGPVMPCEEAVMKNKVDRSQLLSAVRANISMVNCMYIENERAITDCMQAISARTGAPSENQVSTRISSSP